jgi:hypothetical protein
LQDAVAPDAFEGEAAQLVLVEVVGGDWSGAQGADARDQDVPVGGARPGGAPVFEPGQQGVAGELAEGLAVTGEGDAPAGQIDIVQGEFADGPGAACTAAKATARRWAGVTAACSTDRISSAVIGSTVRSAPRPVRAENVVHVMRPGGIR